jgi:hypothetical protein
MVEAEQQHHDAQQQRRDAEQERQKMALLSMRPLEWDIGPFLY